MHSVRAPRNGNAVNFAVDTAIFVAFLVAMAPRFSGIAIHEWLSIAFAAAIVTHHALAPGTVGPPRGMLLSSVCASLATSVSAMTL